MKSAESNLDMSMTGTFAAKSGLHMTEILDRPEYIAVEHLLVASLLNLEHKALGETSPYLVVLAP